MNGPGSMLDDRLTPLRPPEIKAVGNGSGNGSGSGNAIGLGAGPGVGRGMGTGLAGRPESAAVVARRPVFPGPPRWTKGSELLIATDSTAAVAEAMRTLRAQLALQWMDQRQTQFLSIVSVGRGEGRSFIAANLAVACAQLQERTLLIDMDLRHGRQHRIFRVANDEGLSTLLSHGSSGQEIQPVEGYETLSLLTAGPQSPHPQELLAARAMTPVLDHVRARYDIVIVDTPAWSCGADAQIISAQTRQALLISAPGRATRDDTGQMIDALRQVGVAIVGAAVNHR